MNLFRKLVLITTLLTLCLIVLGAYVRLSDAGLGCPDWPGCYGALSVPQSESAIQHAHQAYPDKPVDSPRAWKEMVHRYLAGFVGVCILALAVIGWMERKHLRVSPWLPSTLVLVVAMQAILGMLTVTLLLKPAIVTAHLLGGMTTLAILVWITHRHWGVTTNEKISHHLTLLIRGALLVIFMQIFLGGWTSTNYAALACTDFPTCHGVLIPAMDHASGFHLFRALGEGVDGKPLTLEALTAIQWTHRIGALIVALYMSLLSVCLLKHAAFRLIAILLLVVLSAQIIIGIGNLVLYLPLLLAVAHNLGAALLLIVIVVLNAKITQSKRSNN